MKIEITRQGNFILACLLTHFIFFGYLSNIYAKSIGENILFLYNVMLLPIPTPLSVLWLTIIVALIICMGVFTFASKIEASDKKLFIILLAFISCVLIIPIVIAFPELQGAFIQVSIPDFSVIILAVIVFLMVYREEFTEFGIKNSVWLVLLIVIESWIWYFFIVDFNILIIPLYFIRFESYLTILILLGINLSTALLAGYAKNKIKEYKKKLINKPIKV